MEHIYWRLKTPIKKTQVEFGDCYEYKVEIDPAITIPELYDFAQKLSTNGYGVEFTGKIQRGRDINNNADPMHYYAVFSTYEGIGD